MHAITGVTGRVGGAVARHLLAAGQPVRAVLRDAARAADWIELGCDAAIATMEDAAALACAFREAETVFVLPPSCFDPAPDFAEARRVIAAVDQALRAARPARVVCLSTVGAQATQRNLLSQRTLLEQALAALPLPVTFLRPAWFLENLAWDIAPARAQGLVPSFLQPLERALPMVATADVGRVAAELLLQAVPPPRVVELEGPAPVSPRQIADALGAALGRPVRAEAVPRDTWEAVFRGQGMREPGPRIAMLDGFNQGWITFEGRHGPVQRGRIGLHEVVRTLLGHGPAAA